jgi:DNA adenine methylase
MLGRTTIQSKSLPLKWHGGKSYLSSWILSHFPDHIHYVEPYFGGGSVLFAKPNSLIENHSEVINDLNGDVVNFWKVLRDQQSYETFLRKVQATPFAQELWDSAISEESDDPVARALHFFIRYRQSRQGLGTDFATMSRTRTRRQMNEQVSSWLSAIDGLPEAHNRLMRVVVLNHDAVQVIRKEDGPSTFFYLDPPYLHSTRTAVDCYEHEMPLESHEELLATLATLQGKFLLSGYPSDLYQSYSNRNGWNTTALAIDNKASSQKVKPTKLECLWMNY